MQWQIYLHLIMSNAWIIGGTHHFLCSISQFLFRGDSHMLPQLNTSL